MTDIQHARDGMNAVTKLAVHTIPTIHLICMISNLIANFGRLGRAHNWHPTQLKAEPAIRLDIMYKDTVVCANLVEFLESDEGDYWGRPSGCRE